MTYKLFIDDLRDPVTDDWVVARSSEQAIEVVRNRGLPVEIAFDHDLGGDDTTMKFINWLPDYFASRVDWSFPKDFKYTIHSQNPVGAANIRCAMENLIWFCGRV